jgi:cytochrome P450
MSATDPPGIQSFPEELASREAWLEPFPWYREMRESTPVRYDASRRSWDVFRHDDVKRILDDDSTFSVDPRNAADFREPENEGEGLILDTMLFEDPPRHDVLRSVVEEPFNPRAIGELEGRLREVTAGLLDDALEGDNKAGAGEGTGTGTTGKVGAGVGSRMDVVADLAYPLPVIAIAELLGVPPEDRDRFKRWSDTVVAAASAEEGGREFIEQQNATQREMGAYFLEMIEDRRENPREDLMTRIATAEAGAGDERLSHREALGTAILLLVAGNITTTNLIANAVRCFAEADLLDELAGDERALGTATGEVLRYRSPVQAMARIATEDVTVGGEEIEAGERVIAWLGSANRDEGQFADAESFVPVRSPNQHLGFGHGTHYCLGAPLARLEANVALSELFDRCRGIEPTNADLQPTRSSFIYGVESLPIAVEAART